MKLGFLRWKRKRNCFQVFLHQVSLSVGRSLKTENWKSLNEKSVTQIRRKDPRGRQGGRVDARWDDYGHRHQLPSPLPLELQSGCVIAQPEYVSELLQFWSSACVCLC